MTYQRLCQFANISLLPDPTDKYKLDERIGEGTYGEVFRAVDLQTGKIISIVPCSLIFLVHRWPTGVILRFVKLTYENSVRSN